MKSLPKIPDRSVIYYKITNKEENKRKLQYHDGLVIDHQKFDNNPKHSCVKGGIYFTTKEHLYKFFGFGIWIRPVTIPSDAKVMLDPEGDKYRADKLFFYPRKSINFYFTDLFNKETFPMEYYWHLASSCSEYFDEWFDKSTFPKEEYWCLPRHCSKHFDKWFDKRAFPERHYLSLTKHCSEHFDKWFDKETFPERYYYCLAEDCSEHFDKWFDKSIFSVKNYWYLAKHCLKQLRRQIVKILN